MQGMSLGNVHVSSSTLPPLSGILHPGSCWRQVGEPLYTSRNICLGCEITGLEKQKTTVVIINKQIKEKNVSIFVCVCVCVLGENCVIPQHLSDSHQIWQESKGRLLGVCCSASYLFLLFILTPWNVPVKPKEVRLQRRANCDITLLSRTNIYKVVKRGSVLSVVTATRDNSPLLQTVYEAPHFPLPCRLMWSSQMNSALTFCQKKKKWHQRSMLDTPARK